MGLAVPSENTKPAEDTQTHIRLGIRLVDVLIEVVPPGVGAGVLLYGQAGNDQITQVLIEVQIKLVGIGGAHELVPGEIEEMSGVAALGEITGAAL